MKFLVFLGNVCLVQNNSSRSTILPSTAGNFFVWCSQTYFFLRRPSPRGQLSHHHRVVPALGGPGRRLRHSDRPHMPPHRALDLCHQAWLLHRQTGRSSLGCAQTLEIQSCHACAAVFHKPRLAFNDGLLSFSFCVCPLEVRSI